MGNVIHKDTVYAFNVTAIILIALFMSTAPLLSAFEKIQQNVVMSISEQTQTAAAFVPTTFSVEIQNASSTLLNAVEFEIHYDQNALLVTKVIPHTTLCEDRFIITNTINHALGTILFQCGTITPFSQLTGTVATIEAIPLTSGTSSITFGKTTHVLAHDGLGSDATGIKKDYLLTAL